MKKETNTLKKGNMKLIKFLFAALAGFGLVKLFGYITEADKGKLIVTKGGNTHPITAQGWNAFKNKI